MSSAAKNPLIGMTGTSMYPRVKRESSLASTSMFGVFGVGFTARPRCFARG